MYGTQKQELRNLSKEEYIALKTMCCLTKNMFNVALFNVRQHYFATNKYLRYENNYYNCKENENYKLLNTDIAQQTIKVVDRSFKSFFGLINKAKKGNYQFNKIELPHYLNKNSFFMLIMPRIRVYNGKFDIPMSPEFRKLYGKITINFPSNLKDKKIKEVRVYPKHKADFFEIEYIYLQEEVETPKLDETKYLGIDLGLENLCTCATNYGDTFIIDGRKLKSINQFYNKENARLQGIKDRQCLNKITKKQYLITRNRNNKINDYMNKTARLIINYCLKNSIGNIIMGYNMEFKNKINIGRVTNQQFTLLPIGKLRLKIQSLSKRYGINFIEQEESYTSKSDFLANDDLPIFNADNPKSYTFSGQRISRGQYKSSYVLSHSSKSSIGIILNADINGALNILRKAKVDMTYLQYNVDKIKQPQRIKVD